MKYPQLLIKHSVPLLQDNARHTHHGTIWSHCFTAAHCQACKQLLLLVCHSTHAPKSCTYCAVHLFTIVSVTPSIVSGLGTRLLIGVSHCILFELV